MTHNAYLIQKLPPENPQTWAVEGETFLIGRHPCADAALPLLSISRQHAKISATPGGYFIEDLGSRNGTFVSGEPLGEQPRLLRTGDEIVLGGEAVLTFQDPYETIDGKMVGRVEGVWIDPQTGAVWVDSQQIDPPLSPAQHALLSVLYREEGGAVSYERIKEHVWPDSAPEGISKDSINGLIKRLRARLRGVQPNKEYIEALRGHGIRLLKP